MINKSAIVVLMNAYEPAGKGTVWVVLGPYDPTDENSLLPDEMSDAIKIIGPIDLTECPSVVEALKRVFRGCSIDVKEYVFSDD